MPNLILTGTAAAVDRTKTQGIFVAKTPFIHTQSTNGQVTLSYQKAGDVVILLLLISSTTIAPSGVTSSRAADGSLNCLWQPMATAAVVDSPLGTTMVTFMGVVQNPGNDVITLSFTGGTPINSVIGYDLYEFDGGYGPNATWLLDVVSLVDKVASTSVSFPGHSIRYATSELFFAACYSGQVITPTLTSGFLADNGSIYGAEVVYNLAYPAGSVGVTGTQPLSTTYLQMSATLAVAYVQDTTDTTVTLDFSDKIPTGLMWIVYQTSFEVVTPGGIGNPSGTVYLNNRVIATSDVPGATKGPPYWVVRPGDNFYMTVTGATIGAEIVVDVMYQEWANGATPDIPGMV
jgi:hypothetical protein